MNKYKIVLKNRKKLQKKEITKTKRITKLGFRSLKFLSLHLDNKYEDKEK